MQNTNNLPNDLSSSINVKVIPAIEFIIPDDERAVDDVINGSYIAATEQGYFNGLYGKAQLKGVMNDRIYADKVIERDGYNYIRFVQQYTNGSISPMIIISQAELVKYTAYTQNELPSFVSDSLKGKVAKFMDRVTSEYYGKVCYSERLPIFDILNILLLCCDDLPLAYNGNQTFNIEAFYSRVVQIIVSSYQYVLDYSKKSYYVLSDVEMENIAIDLEMNKEQLLKLLYQYHFLYLTESSNHYKTKVRIGDTTEWDYCLLRLETLNEINTTNEE